MNNKIEEKEKGLISYNETDVYAFVPQCIDNQFIPESLIKNFNPEDKSHQTKRYNETRKELIRSMIYSAQIIVNRIAFFNNDVFISFYNSDEDKKALIELFNQHRIIPALFNEKNFKSDSINKNQFSFVDPNKLKIAFDFLDNEVRDSDVNYIRCSDDKDVFSIFKSYFSQFFNEFRFISEEDTERIYSEINPLYSLNSKTKKQNIENFMNH
ncbi:MAG: hypothetical protein HQK93_03295, partial [Nitrospirae bacterium]|nr:hypothetical protein [Nitrospirota bacterium]